MARNAQCDAIGVSYGAHDAAQLQTLSPVGLVHSVTELRDFLEQRG
jgi:phosphoglycolate phosphatase